MTSISAFEQNINGARACSRRPFKAKDECFKCCFETYGFKSAPREPISSTPSNGDLNRTCLLFCDEKNYDDPCNTEMVLERETPSTRIHVGSNGDYIFDD